MDNLILFYFNTLANNNIGCWKFKLKESFEDTRSKWRDLVKLMNDTMIIKEINEANQLETW